MIYMMLAFILIVMEMYANLGISCLITKKKRQRVGRALCLFIYVNSLIKWDLCYFKLPLNETNIHEYFLTNEFRNNCNLLFVEFFIIRINNFEF